MTQDDNPLTALFGSESRRSFMKKAAAASGTAAVGVSGASGALAQDETETGTPEGDGGAMRGLMFNTQFNPAAQFEVVSQSLQWAPVESDQDGDDFLAEENDDLLFNNPEVFANYDTRVIRYQFGGGNFALLFPRSDANVQQGQVYELSQAFGAFGVEDVGEGVQDPLLFEGGNELGLITVEFSPAQGGGGATPAPEAGTPTQTGNQTAGGTATGTTEAEPTEMTTVEEG